MRKIILRMSAGAACLAIPGAARAEMVDMSTVTCAQISEMSEEDGSMFLIWLDGWLAGQKDATTLEVDELSAQIDGIAEECEQQPALSVMNAAKAYLAE